MPVKLKYADSASKAMIKHAETENIETVWDRYDKMRPQCKFGALGICCKICSMGPCRINPFGRSPQEGVCGANVDTIVARNLIRMIASGAAAHSDHGRDIAHTLLMAATNPDSDYQVKDEEKLMSVADVYGIKTDGKEINTIAEEVARAALEDFGRYEGEIKITDKAPEARREVWKKLNIYPRAVDREIVEIMHRTHMGVDCDYKNVLRHGMRAALGDGWGGSMIATELSDVLFRKPNPVRSEANLGILKKDFVNIIVHGHEPTLSDVIAILSHDKKLNAKAKEKGAKGIVLGGICCTANEILMRHGIPLAGSFLQQELAIVTGAVDMMVVDVQCLMPSLSTVADCFHTKLITTSPKCKMPGVQHIEFHEDKAVVIATQILETAIDNFPNRTSAKVHIPDVTEKCIAGFTTEYVSEMLGGKFRASYLAPE